MRIEGDLLIIARKYLRRFTLFRDEHGFFKDEGMLFDCIEWFYQDTTEWFITTGEYTKKHKNIVAYLKQRMAWRTRDFRRQVLYAYGLDRIIQLGDESTEQHVTAPSLDKARKDLRNVTHTDRYKIPDFREDLRPAHQALIHRQLDQVLNVKGITERDRQLLILRYAYGCTPQEVADIMGFKNANVASKEISKALKKVQKKSKINSG